MIRPPGRRTQQLAVYLSSAEAAVWDELRAIQRGAGWAGCYPPGRGAWIAERVQDELIKVANAGDGYYVPRAECALAALLKEEHRLGQPDWYRAHGRPKRMRPRCVTTLVAGPRTWLSAEVAAVGARQASWWAASEPQNSLTRPRPVLSYGIAHRATQRTATRTGNPSARALPPSRLPPVPLLA